MSFCGVVIRNVCSRATATDARISKPNSARRLTLISNWKERAVRKQCHQLSRGRQNSEVSPTYLAVLYLGRLREYVVSLRRLDVKGRESGCEQFGSKHALDIDRFAESHDVADADEKEKERVCNFPDRLIPTLIYILLPWSLIIIGRCKRVWWEPCWCWREWESDFILPIIHARGGCHFFKFDHGDHGAHGARQWRDVQPNYIPEWKLPSCRVWLLQVRAARANGSTLIQPGFIR